MSLFKKHPASMTTLLIFFLSFTGAVPATAAEYCQSQNPAGITGNASAEIAGQTPTKAIPWVKAAYEGAGHRLPANFFAGMMFYESDFNPTIRNSLGYMGLCQIGTEEWRHLTGGTPSSPNIYDPIIHAKNCGKLSAENLDKVLKARATNLPANLRSLPDWQLVILAHNAGPAYLTPKKNGRIPNETRRSIQRMMPYMNATTSNSSVSVASGGGLRAGAATNPRALKAAIQKAIKPAAWDGKFDAPAPGKLHVTSPYGPRKHPVTGRMQSLHAGTDYSQAAGNPQYATAPGTVISTKYEGTGGNTVCINHGEYAGATWKTCHRHLSKFLVKPGQQVQKGTPIGLTGATGRVTGAHIHYEIYQNGKPINPEPFMKGATATPTSEAGSDPAAATSGFCSYLPGGGGGLMGDDAPLNPSGNKVVEAALRERGKPYVWGAEGPNTFDCSGLVKWSYAKGAGINLPHQSGAQANAGTQLPVSAAQPGDVLWKPGHVGIFIGDGKFIHAPKAGDVVKITDMKYSKWQKAIRITKGK